MMTFITPNWNICAPYLLNNFHSTNQDGCDVVALEATVSDVEAVVPEQYKGQQVMGETGCALATDRCPSGPSTVGTEAERTAFLQGLVTSSVLGATCRDVLFWRVMALTDNDPPLGCEASFGVTAANNSLYDTAGSAFFRAVGGTGLSQSCGQSHQGAVYDTPPPPPAAAAF